MFREALSRKKCIPRLRKRFPGREIVRSDRFLFLEKVSLSLVSGLKDCLTSLRCLPSLRSGRQLLRSVRQPSFFPTTAESETFSRKKKSVFTPVPSLGNAFLGRGNIYSSLSPDRSRITCSLHWERNVLCTISLEIVKLFSTLKKMGVRARENLWQEILTQFLKRLDLLMLKIWAL